MKEMLISLLQSFGLAWWVEVTTDAPRCTYYFGPFASEKDAAIAKDGYIEDLEQEGAVGIKVIVKRDKPQDLTVYDEAAERRGRGNSASAFSS